MTENPWAGRHVDKDVLRARVWSALSAAGAVAGDPVGSIPDFAGADEAAARLATLPIWTSARTVKCTPDACQAPIRRRALDAGKHLYMAYPRLVVDPCFIELDPADLTARGVPFDVAAEMDGAIAHGRPIPFEEMRPIDLVNVGCVAVTPSGGRTGKGAGFADLELGLLREHGLVTATTPVATTVHPLSIVEDAELPTTSTDSPLDWIVTADRVIETHSTAPRPTGIVWDLIQPDQFDTIPVLRRLRPAARD